MIQPSRGSTIFDRKGGAGRDSGGKAKEETKTKSVADAEDDRVGYRPRKQPQRAVLSTQKVVSQIEATQDVKTAARNADGRQCMMIHSMIVAVTLRICDRTTACAELIQFFPRELIRDCPP